MRIRSIKPEFWRSSDISELAIEDRLLFIGLWSYVDDNGVGLDKLSSITADLFADDLEQDPGETFARVSRGLQHLSASGRILRYTLENVDYLSVTNWTKHQRIDRPGKARLPQYDAELATIREGVASLPVNVSPGSGNRGTGDQGTGEQGQTRKRATPTPIPDDFELTNERQAWSKENTPAVNTQLQTENFIDYWRNGDGAGKKKSNWETTWRNWMRKKQEDAEARGWKPAPPKNTDPRRPQGW